MVDQEDGEEFILDIVNEIVESTMKVLHDQYIVSQTLPYTIQETKNLLLQIIEVCVMNRPLSYRNFAILAFSGECNCPKADHPMCSWLNIC